MLYQIDPLRYPEFTAIADAHDCGKVYPLSIAEGFQKGDVFTNAMENYSSILFWAACGFAYLSGKAEECFLEDVYELMLDSAKSGSRRFLIISKDEHVQKHFAVKHGAALEKRYLFQYSGNRKMIDPLLPPGYELKEIDHQLLEKISGNITPALFWREADDFLEKGKGYCVTCGDTIASWAFSAAISSGEIDIGIETNAKYKQQGLGRIAAQKMIQYAIGQEKDPVWACHYQNIASEKMAEKLGFVKVSECAVIKMKI